MSSVSTTYPELFHYTTASGLHGILESQQLWATHASYLNDAEEVVGFFDRRFKEFAASTVEQALQDAIADPRIKAQVDEFGGFEVAAEKALDEITSMFRRNALEVNQPFITSFCGASTHEISCHGLLSQWRGYGTDGGYAVVFDTKKLEVLLREEVEQHLYAFGQMGDVVYYEGEGKQHITNDETMKEYEQTLQSAIKRILVNPNDRHAFMETYLPICGLSTLHKHAGFREEAEVRVVLIPALGSMFRLESDNGDARPKKNVRFHNRSGLLVPFISMFDAADLKNSLPIRRIVVGPHPQKERRRASVEMMLEKYGIDAEVTVSDIPFSGK